MSIDKSSGLSANSIVAIVLSLMTLLSILLVVLYHNGVSGYVKSHSIPYVVISNAGESIAKVQHKHNASLISETWVRVKATETGMIRDYTISNPFIAKAMVEGSAWVVSNPSIDDFDRYGYDTPWYTSNLLMFFVGFFVIVCLACWCVFLIHLLE